MCFYYCLFLHSPHLLEKLYGKSIVKFTTPNIVKVELLPGSNTIVGTVEMSVN